MPRKPKNSLSANLIAVNRSSQLDPGRTIVLEGDDVDGLFQREVRGVVVTGQVSGVRTAPECNIVETVLTLLTMQTSTLTSCDIKDSAIRESHFVGCTFGSSSITHNAIVSSLFEECSFRYTDIQHCDFIQTEFLKCDLRNLLIKNCTFSRCTFRNCQTSNKLLEMCRLGDCIFEDTDLQIETLAENFGITASAFRGRLRADLADSSRKFMALDELPDWLRYAPAHPLNKLSIDYFLRETLLEGSPYLDAALDIQSWIPMFKTAGSFVVVLTQLVDFLIWLYDQQKVTAHTLICFHSMTDALLRVLDNDETPHRQSLAGIGGVHLSLARIVDTYLMLLEALTCSPGVETRLLVEGPGTIAYYRRALAPFFARGDVAINEIKPHNSPWELAISFGSIGPKVLFLALFLATRTKIELSRIVRTQQSESSGPTQEVARRIPKPPTSMTEPILSLDFGGSRVARVPPNLRLRAYLPGNLVAELQLGLASQRIAKLRKILKDLL